MSDGELSFLGITPGSLTEVHLIHTFQICFLIIAYKCVKSVLAQDGPRLASVSVDPDAGV